MTPLRRRFRRPLVVVAIAAALLGGGIATAAISIAATSATTAINQDWPLVNRGDTGRAVTTVQRLLVARGYRVTVDGAFGGRTQTAVESFQRAKGLEVDGVVGPQTWGALIVQVSSGSTNSSAVKAVQERLNWQGAALTVDGAFGARTKAAVRGFQSSHALAVDGVVGPRTWLGLVGVGGSGPPPPPPASGSLRARIGTLALQQVGNRESDGTCKKYGPCTTTAWCAMFVEWVWKQAGVSSVPTSWVARATGLWGQQHGTFHSAPKVGDLAVYGTPANSTGGHVSIVVKVYANGNIDTVDGNFGDKVTHRVNLDPDVVRSGTGSLRISGFVGPPGG